VVALATGQGNPSALAVSADSVYWATLTPLTPLPMGGIHRLMFGDATYTTPVKKQALISAIAVDEAYLYWIEPTSIRRAPIGGGNEGSLADEAAAGIALDADNVYWTTPPDRVRFTGKLGGTPLDLATGQLNPRGIAVQGDYIYWANAGDMSAPGLVARRSRETTLETVAVDKLGPLQIAVGAGLVYWTNASDQMLYHANAPGPQVAGNFFTKVEPQSGVAVDDEHVYWTNEKLGTVSRAPLGGGPVLILAQGQDTPRQIVVDEYRVYWLTAGAVMMAAK
jgi:hypothetical protein